jgi:hypothetical protein
MDTVQFKEELLKDLHNSVIAVKFIKMDGSERTMRCTLQESFFKDYVKKTDKENKPDDEAIRVWDIDKEAWRSFRYDSVVEVYK